MPFRRSHDSQVKQATGDAALVVCCLAEGHSFEVKRACLFELGALHGLIAEQAENVTFLRGISDFVIDRRGLSVHLDRFRHLASGRPVH